MNLYILQALEGCFTIIFVVGVGWLLAKKGWFDDKSSALISRLVTNVSLPLYMIVGLTRNFTLEKIITLAPNILLPVGSMLLAMVIGKIVCRAISVPPGRRGVFETNFFIANTMFIGLPVNLALFGDESIPSVMLYYMVNLILFWTVGQHNIISDTSGNESSLFSLTALKKLWSPPLMGLVAALLLIVAGVKIPGFLFKGCQYVGNLTTPLSLIFIGIEIAKMSFSELRLDRDIIVSLLGRFVVCPVCVLALSLAVAVEPISLKVFTMQAAMPAMTQMAIVAKQYGADSVYAATLSFVTIIVSLLVIPVYMVIVNLAA